MHIDWSTVPFNPTNNSPHSVYSLANQLAIEVFNKMSSNDSTTTNFMDQEMEKSSNALVQKDGAIVTGPPPQDANEYPKGASLAFVVVALILSIFLASLDMVIIPLSPFPSSFDEF